MWKEVPEKVGELTGAPPLVTGCGRPELCSLCNQMTVSHCPAPEMGVSLFPTVPEGLIRSPGFSRSFSFLSCWVKATFIFYLFLYVCVMSLDHTRLLLTP